MTAAVVSVFAILSNLCRPFYLVVSSRRSRARRRSRRRGGLTRLQGAYALLTTTLTDFRSYAIIQRVTL